ncbi:MAG: FecR family protein [Massilibacteroides sp.]|nr:FecR family protein [Massilibacteroides sp.]MDD3061236.1 FecR family protein [Massilibacteroides sp.]MDD4115679.1 FecR family protein [Massilibacteroides sp.]MDD4661295.1 FecR family protein [Massilibacteroides sp.]
MNKDILSNSKWNDQIMDYLTGNISENDKRRFLEWRNISPENEKYFQEIAAIWDASEVSTLNKKFDWHKPYIHFCQCIRESSISKRPFVLRLTMLKYVAVVIPFVFLSYYSFLYFQSKIKPTLSVQITKIEAPKGSKTCLTLVDGTIVWLNAGSTIEYPSDFGGMNRKIILNGEAYFEVAHNKECPFIVTTNKINVKVLGTKFNIRAYVEDPEVTVALLQGSVELDTQKDTLIMKPNERVNCNLLNGVISVTQEDTKSAIDWTQDKITFQSETFEQIVRTLERIYNVKINIHNEQIKNRKFTGDFVNNETIEQILNVMSTSKNFQYKIKGNIVDLY